MSRKLVYNMPETKVAIGMGYTSIYKAIGEGKLVAKKYGRKTLITAESLEAFIANLPNKETVGGGNV